MRKRYTDEQKALALRAVERCGGLTDTALILARELVDDASLSKSTLYEWGKKATSPKPLPMDTLTLSVFLGLPADATRDQIASTYADFIAEIRAMEAIPSELFDAVGLDVAATKEDVIAKLQALFPDNSSPSDNPKHRDGYVYLFKLSRVERMYKIGMSIEVPRRFYELRRDVKTILPSFELECLHSIQCADPRATEDWLHEIFKDKRLEGEWFNLDDSDVRWIMSIEEVLGDPCYL